MTLGEQIRAAREAKGMTLRALARAAGVSAPYMSDLEHDRRNPSKQTLDRIASAAEIDVVLLEAAIGYTRDLADWIRRDPSLVALLRESRRTGGQLRIGGQDCPCRSCRGDFPYAHMPMDAPAKVKP